MPGLQFAISKNVKKILIELTIVCLFKAGTPPSKTKTGFILKYNSLHTL